MNTLTASSASNTDDNSNEVALCFRCRKIDLSAAYKQHLQSIPESGLPICELGTIHHSWLESTCPLCRIVAKQRYSTDCVFGSTDGPVYSLNAWLYAFPATTSRQPKDDSSLVEPRIALRVVEEQGWAGTRKSELAMPFNRRELLVVDPQFLVPQTPYTSAVKDTGKLARAVHSLLNDCKTGHRQCSVATKVPDGPDMHGDLVAALEFPVQARVIDCAALRLVPLATDSRYLALSYVWGPKAASDPLKASQALQLPPELPQTIRDAIHFTAAIGMQYLWVDRYCIDQHPPEAKQDQIAQMANIYEHAFATICALGPDDSHGIPGVSEPIHVDSMRTAGLTLANSPKHISHHLRESVWTTRGWTLQEVFTAKRCLFFSSDGVTMLCDSGTFTQELYGDYSIRTIDPTILSQNRETLIFEPLMQEYLSPELRWDLRPLSTVDAARERFHNLQHDYCRRHLSYETDALNAFLAILQKLPFPSYNGIPCFDPPSLVRLDSSNITSDDKIHLGFVYELCWQPVTGITQQGRVRSMFPSWSWITQPTPPYIQYMRKFLGPLLWARVGILNADASEVTGLPEFIQRHRRCRVLPSGSRCLSITSVTASWRIDQSPAKNVGGALRITLSGLSKKHLGMLAANLFVAGDRSVNPGLAGRRKSTVPLDVSVTNLQDAAVSTELVRDVLNQDFHSTCTVRGGLSYDAAMEAPHGSASVERKMEGLAILMIFDVSIIKDKPTARSIWLAIRRLEDGTFEREGLIEVHQHHGNLQSVPVTVNLG